MIANSIYIMLEGNIVTSNSTMIIVIQNSNKTIYDFNQCLIHDQSIGWLSTIIVLMYVPNTYSFPSSFCNRIYLYWNVCYCTTQPIQAIKIALSIISLTIGGLICGINLVHFVLKRWFTPYHNKPYLLTRVCHDTFKEEIVYWSYCSSKAQSA